MEHHPFEVFDRLLALGPQPAWGSIHIAQESRDFFNWRRQKHIERTVEEFIDSAHRVVTQLATTWGPPQFAGEVDETPATEWAYWRGYRWLAFWPRSESLAFVAVMHEDKELPVSLLFGVEKLNPD